MVVEAAKTSMISELKSIKSGPEVRSCFDEDFDEVFDFPDFCMESS